MFNFKFWNWKKEREANEIWELEQTIKIQKRILDELIQLNKTYKMITGEDYFKAKPISYFKWIK
jgi:hypothetical protein